MYEDILARGLSPSQETYVALIDVFVDAQRTEDTLPFVKMLHTLPDGIPSYVSGLVLTDQVDWRLLLLTGALAGGS